MKSIFAFVAMLILCRTGEAHLPLQQDAWPAKRFPVESLDFYGYCEWEVAEPLAMGTQQAKVALVKGQAATAYSGFLKAWDLNHGDFAALHGLVLAGRSLKKLPELIRRIDREQAKIRQKGGELDMKLLFALFYTRQMAAYFNIQEGDKAAYVSDFDKSLGFYSSAQEKLGPLTFNDRRFAIMYTGVLHAVHELPESRRAAKLQLQRFPDFVQLRLTLAKTYMGGSLAKSICGVPVKLTEDEKPNPPECLRLAKEVIRQAPGFRFGYYEAGVAAAGVNDPAARKYLQQFLKMEPEDTARRQFAKWTLDHLRA